MLEAVSCGLLTQAFLFGHPVALIKLVRDGKDFVKVYRPGEESRAAGYVPRLWLELGGSNQDDGCLLEVWPDTEDLVQPVDTPEGQRPLPMPVTNARVLTVRALNVLRDGTIVSPAEALS